ncbi:MAG: isoamylase early set domain-containing protein [Desulfobacterales bacterium]|nr:isoamylase early set domain-containing protein [Desulfobacterales bacterium]MDD4073386.1 isoamylase early set domain-containing protein [Desulfobacterales bacterium]MDD4394120.1 isoamylase early set domain-containing protein [Desulfobacterales bacterium]
MIKKSYSKTGNFCRVTFKLPAAVHAEAAMLCGDFNEWDTGSNPMRRLKDGGFSFTLSLACGRNYRYRYLLDGHHWENDWDADDYVPNDFGGEDSVVNL